MTAFPTFFRFAFALTSILSASPPRLRAQVGGPPPHPNFIFFRYASLTSLSLYGGYGQGRWLGFFGMVQSPRTGYREIAGGVGVSVVPSRHLGGVIGLAAASARDAWYVQLYLQSNLGFGHLRTYLSIAGYAPVEAGGSRQIKLNPALVMWRLLRRLEAGGAYVLLTSDGSQPVQQAGPALQLSVPNGRATLEVLQRVRTSRIDLRVTFQAYW